VRSVKLKLTGWMLAAGAMLALGRSLSTPEGAIVRYIDAHGGEAIELLQRVVDINSGTMNLGGVREVGRVFQTELETLGFDARWIDGGPWQRAGHLVAEHPGPGPRMLLVGHLDTVFEPASPFQEFERLSATAARGPGVIDMKGGDVIIVYALKALQAAGILRDMNVVVFMTGDEEAPGEPLSLARAALVDAARGADAALGFEAAPGDSRFTVIGRRGTAIWDLRVTALAAHASQIFRDEIGTGAIFEAARILNGFRETLGGEEHLTLNPGLILGGTAVQAGTEGPGGSAAGKHNVIAGEAIVSGDLRALTAGQFRDAKRRMQAIVKASLPQAQAVLTFEDGYPPLAASEGNARLLAWYSRVSEDLGLGPVAAASPDRAGAADVSFVAAHVNMVLDGLGLIGHDDHTPDETADLRTLASQTKRAAVLLARLAHGTAVD
jgi:glutamate carboxypeptidase